MDFHNVRYVIGDFQNPSFELESCFDAIFSVRAIEYMQDKTYVLTRIYKLLKKGGFALILTKNPYAGTIPFSFLLTRKIFKPPKLFSNLINYKDLLLIAKEVGFNNASTYPVIISLYVPFFHQQNNKILSDKLHQLFYKRRMNPSLLTFVESYALVLYKD
jgi:ubiquinone/menaquinone biosynthesis C-methylase UbiE